MDKFSAEPATLETIKRFYREDGGVHFLTEPTGIDKACQLVSAIGRYNDFSPVQVNRVLVELQYLADKHEQSVRFAIGREYSPLIWVFGLDFSNWVAGRSRVQNLFFVKAKADEVEIYMDRIRVWWN